MTVDEDICDLEKRLEHLKKLPPEKTYVCKVCGGRFHKGFTHDEDICYRCESARGMEKFQQELKGKLLGAIVVGFDIDDELSEVTIEKEGKRFKITADGYEDRYLELEEVT